MSIKAKGALVAAVAAGLIFFAGYMPQLLVAEKNQTFGVAAEPWKGNKSQFVQDMLVKWRDDYSRLSTGELRMRVKEILSGLQNSGDRHTIETKTSTIVFENDGGKLSCTISTP